MGERRGSVYRAPLQRLVRRNVDLRALTAFLQELQDHVPGVRTSSAPSTLERKHDVGIRGVGPHDPGTAVQVIL